ncbi:MAG: hypothetical protein AAF725_14715, partial [Acidobacteriota bacterium]
AGDRHALRADLLKVAHHGSKSSSDAEFLAAVSPRLSVIQAGRGNSYGHPHPSVLERLGAAGGAVLRTDLHGQIRVRWREGGALRTRVARSPRGLPVPGREARIGR